MLYFCRTHPTSVVGANFCGCIFFDPCSDKIIKKIVKKIKSLIPTSAFWKNQGKILKKEKSVLFTCTVRSFHRPLFSPCCATSRHVLASSCYLYFGSGLNNR
jgi:hypothetical protein